MRGIIFGAIIALLFTGCTQEVQNKLGRAVQNWTGTDGVLEVYAGNKLVKRFMKIDKISTAYGTDDNRPRPYRYGYGYLDAISTAYFKKRRSEKRSTSSLATTPPTIFSTKIRDDSLYPRLRFLRIGEQK